MHFILLGSRYGRKIEGVPVMIGRKSSKDEQEGIERKRRNVKEESMYERKWAREEERRAKGVKNK